MVLRTGAEDFARAEGSRAVSHCEGVDKKLSTEIAGVRSQMEAVRLGSLLPLSHYHYLASILEELLLPLPLPS